MARSSTVLAVALCCLAVFGTASAAGNRKLQQGGCTTILEVLSTPGLESLKEAAVLAGLADLAASPDTAGTLFAPNNEAFADLLDMLNVTSLTDAVSLEAVKAVLAYHLVPQRITTQDLANYAGKPIETALPGQTLKLEVEGQKVTVMGYGSDATVVLADVLTGCGKAVIHIIDAVLLPDLTAASSSVASQSA